MIDWNWYRDVVLAGTLSGLATVWIWEKKHAEDRRAERRMIARYVRDQLNKQGLAALGHALALEIGGKDYGNP